VEHVKNARAPFEGTEDGATNTDQFRLVVRSLKRWNDEAIQGESDDKPTGLALLLLTEKLLQRRTFVDGEPDDRTALALLARAAADTPGRLTAPKPTPEYEDVIGRISEEGMTALKDRFRKLADVLEYAGREPDPVKACEALKKVFGDDFPVPTPEETARKTAAPAIITSSSSASGPVSRRS
jgi:hypothetical protein